MQLNLSAMIDVIFLLLIYFVLTANFAIDEGILPANLPRETDETTQSLAPPPQPLDIRLRSHGDVGVTIGVPDARPLHTFTEMADHLATLRFDPAENPGGIFGPDDPVVIRPARDVRWQHVVNAFNAAIRARYTNVTLAEPE